MHCTSHTAQRTHTVGARVAALGHVQHAAQDLCGAAGGWHGCVTVHRQSLTADRGVSCAGTGGGRAEGWESLRCRMVPCASCGKWLDVCWGIGELDLLPRMYYVCRRRWFCMHAGSFDARSEICGMGFDRPGVHVGRCDVMWLAQRSRSASQQRNM